MNKSNKPNDGMGSTNDTIESISIAFLHLAKVIGDRHCNDVIDVLLEDPIGSVRFFKI